MIIYLFTTNYMFLFILQTLVSKYFSNLFNRICFSILTQAFWAHSKSLSIILQYNPIFFWNFIWLSGFLIHKNLLQILFIFPRQEHHRECTLFWIIVEEWLKHELCSFCIRKVREDLFINEEKVLWWPIDKGWIGSLFFRGLIHVIIFCQNFTW